jgi:acetyltransferase-like isoleucine patch superfamily enzyme
MASWAFSLTQYVLGTAGPAALGGLTRLLYASDRVKIGRDLRAHGVPRVICDAGTSLEIGDGVELRRDVEIRVHGSASIRIEDGARIDRGVRILAANQSRVEIGAGARIGLYSVLNGGDSIRIGRKCLVSGFVYLQTSMHEHRAPGAPIQSQGFRHAPIALGDDVWLGAHVVVLPGASIGAGAVVGSNAVVTRPVDAFSVVAGIPARPIGSRTEEG